MSELKEILGMLDVRAEDGEPWEVAELAGNQLISAIALALECIEDLSWAARGSWMSQEHHRTGLMPDAKDFSEQPVNRKLDNVWIALKDARRQARVVTKFAAHDPRSV